MQNQKLEIVKSINDVLEVNAQFPTMVKTSEIRLICKNKNEKIEKKDDVLKMNAKQPKMIKNQK